MLFQNNGLIGLDIQPKAIHLVHVDSHQQIKMRHTLVTEKTYFQDGKINDWNALTDWLQGVVRQQKLRNHKVAISLPSAQVHVLHINVANDLSPEELAYEIDKQIATDLPWMKEALYKDFHITKLDGSLNQNLVTVVVSRRSYIDQLQKSLHRAALSLRVIDVDIFALKRTVCASLGVDFNHVNYLILYINNSNASLIFVTGMHLALLHQWEIENELRFQEQVSQQINLAMQLQTEKPTSLILCGTQGYIDVISHAAYRLLGLEIHRPQLVIEDQYWLALSLALCKAV